MIQLKDVSVVFESDGNPIVAVDQVSLAIPQGQIYGIVGYSGAGKSTLVRTMNLLQPPTSGEVHVNGQDLLALTPKDLREARKKIGMIFQHFNLMDSRTIFDNVAFPLKGSGLTKEAMSQKVHELLELVGLADRASHYPSQLSGGQKQRVAIARALANDPDILLCDEATSALDPKTTGSILGLLKKLNERLGLTLVVITHEMAVVKDLCDRVAVMENGQVLEEGSILDIFTHPKEVLTQEFINTATNYEQEVKTLLANESTKALLDQGQLARLRYVGSATTQPLVAELSREYQVDTNIIYGHVEILQQTPVGNLLVIFQGDEDKRTDAVQYLRDQGVVVNFIEGVVNS